MSARKRSDTIRALIISSYGPNLAFSSIEREIDAFDSCSTLRFESRRRLYELFHISRAVDSTIRIVVQKFNSGVSVHGIGSGLESLRSVRPQYYDVNSVSTHKRSVANKRNTFMHRADTYPANEAEIGRFLADCQSCLVWVLKFSNYH